MAKRKRNKRRVETPVFTDEMYEALRREQNIKKLRKKVGKNFGRALRATGYETSDPDIGFRDIIAGLSDAELRELSTVRGVSNVMRKLSTMGKRNAEDDGWVRLATVGESTSERDLNAIRRHNIDTSVISIEDALKKGFVNDGHNIRAINVYSGTEASMFLDRLMSIARYGENYNGWYGKENSTAIPYINRTGRQLSDMIASARMKHTDEEIYQHIKEHSEFVDVKKLADLVEQLVLSIYDEQYRSWTGGVSDKLRGDIDRVRKALSW